MQKKDDGELYEAVLNRNVFISTTGEVIYPDDTPKVHTYSAGTLSYTTIGPDDAGYYYRKTYTYVGADLTAESGWVKQ